MTNREARRQLLRDINKDIARIKRSKEDVAKKIYDCLTRKHHYLESHAREVIEALGYKLRK